MELTTAKEAVCSARVCPRLKPTSKSTSSAESTRGLSRCETAPPTPASGSMACVTVSAPSFGPMAHATRVSGGTIRRMARASSCTLMEMCTRASGSMIRQREWALTRMLMELTMKDSGSTINSTGKVLSHGLMVPATKASTRTGRRRARAG